MSSTIRVGGVFSDAIKLGGETNSCCDYWDMNTLDVERVGVRRGTRLNGRSMAGGTFLLGRGKSS